MNFFLRGDRDYIHVADILEAVRAERADGPDRKYDYVLVRKTDRDIEVQDAGQPYDKGKLVATYKDPYNDLVVTDGGAVVQKRVPCDEADLAAGFQVSDDVVQARDWPEDATFERVAVAAFKFALKTIAFPNEDRRYMFVRLRMDDIPEKGFDLRYTRLVGGKFFEGAILSDGERVGRIYFGYKDL